MNLESQVCSLELAKRLKELEVKQESLFYWIKVGLNVITCQENWNIELIQHNLSNIPKHMISAFTVSELGEMLPSTLNVENGTDFKIFEYIEWKITNKYIINYYSLFPNRQPETPTSNIKVKFHLMENHIFEKNEANARAKMLIHLLENKLIDIKEINND